VSYQCAVNFLPQIGWIVSQIFTVFFVVCVPPQYGAWHRCARLAVAVMKRAGTVPMFSGNKCLRSGFWGPTHDLG
jgi:hypothetical protein